MSFLKEKENICLSGLVDVKKKDLLKGFHENKQLSVNKK